MDREFVFLPKKAFWLALLIFLSAGPVLFARTWTDRQGRQTEAQFVRVKGDSVVLQKGLKPLIIPLKEFCDEDQEYIKEQTSGKGGAKKTSTAKGDAESSKTSDSAASSTPAAKPKNPKNSAEPNPFLSDEEKSAEESPSKDSPKPKAEKAEVPKITTEGGFDERTWTDKKGNKLEANFARLEGKVVVLLKKGEECRYPIEEFCYGDKLYIRQAALELQKYEKFTGNKADAIAQNPPAGQTTMPPMGRMPSMPGGPGMMAQQQADAARRAQEAAAQDAERQRQWLADQERQRNEARQRSEEQQKQQAEIQRQLDEQRRIAQQQAQQMPVNMMPNPQIPISSPVNSYSEASEPCIATKFCMSCKGTVSNSSKAGDRCPHCGVIWDVEEDAHGKEIGWSKTGRYSGYGGLAVVISAIISGIVRYLKRRD